MLFHHIYIPPFLLTFFGFLSSWVESFLVLEDPERFRLARDTTFGQRHLSMWSRSPIFIWVVGISETSVCLILMYVAMHAWLKFSIFNFLRWDSYDSLECQFQRLII